MTGDMQSCTQGNVSHQLNDLTGDMKLACGSGNKDVTWEMQTCSHGNVSHELTEGPHFPQPSSNIFNRCIYSTGKFLFAS